MTSDWGGHSVLISMSSGGSRGFSHNATHTCENALCHADTLCSTRPTEAIGPLHCCARLRGWLDSRLPIYVQNEWRRACPHIEAVDHQGRAPEVSGLHMDH